MSGGKEVRTYGVDARTGHLQYVCSSDGCHVEPAEAGTSGEFLVIRRHSQIVRAIEPRTGTERWNFSVGRHEASLLHKHTESKFHLLFFVISVLISFLFSSDSICRMQS